MLKKLCLAGLLVLFSARVSSAAVEIKDVDKSNWAYAVIVKLIDKGYLDLYSDGTFKPDQPVTRVVLASAIGRLLYQLETGAIKMSAADMKTVKQLSDQFKDEIADVDVRISALDKRISDIESGKVVIQQDLTKATYDFGKKADDIIAENQKLKTDLGILNSQVETLNLRLVKSDKSRKQAQKFLMFGVVVALGVAISN